MPGSRLPQLLWAWLAFGLLLPSQLVAQTAAPATVATDQVTPQQVNVSGGLSERLMCQTAALFQSQVGLIVGLAMGIMGLWYMIRRGKMKPAMFLIIGGALMSALPSLITGGFASMSTFLKSNNISPIDNSSAILSPLSSISNCDSITVNLAGYDTSNPNFVRSGAPDIIGAQTAQHTPGVGVAAPDPNLSGGVSGGGTPAAATAGCGQLVDGGVPTSPFSYARVDPITGVTGRHPGTDIGCRQGVTGNASPIHAAQAGTVVSVITGYGGGYGNHIWVSLPNGHINTYNHMRSINVTNGQAVAANAIVGYCGTTGHSTGPHLHFELRINGTPTDPVAKGCE